MLVRLMLEQFVIVETAVLEFGPGLNALTGETGAGKSILVDALGLVTGDRASADWVRAGATRLVVEAVFELPASAPAMAGFVDVGIDVSEGVLVVRREVGADGRSRAFVNGRQVLLAQLREWIPPLLSLVGQGEARSLTVPGALEALLDRAAGAEEKSAQYREARRIWLLRKHERAAREEEMQATGRDADWLRFQVEEIREAKIRLGERDELHALRDRWRTREEDAQRFRQVRARLVEDEGSIADHVESLLHLLGRTPDPSWTSTAQGLVALRDQVRELVRGLPDEEDEPELDPVGIEERLRLLDRMCKKYGGEESAVLAHAESLEARLDASSELAAQIAQLDSEIAERHAAVRQHGAQLSKIRGNIARELETRAREELVQLGLADAALQFAFENDGEVREHGMDHIALQFRSHGSLEWGDLGKVASGGELSRVLLATQAALGNAIPPGTWVFDEIDQGIGGETALRVGDRLARLSERSQVLLVTHLPLVAARARTHFRVQKHERSGRPSAEVTKLEDEARLRELARMLAGDEESTIARRHARELLAAARTSGAQAG